MKTWTIYLIRNYGGEIMILQSSILIQHSNQHGIVRLSTWNSNLQEEGYWPTCWSCLMTAVPIKVSIMIESMPCSSKLNLKSTRSINLNSRLEVYCWPELRRLGFKHDSIWQHSLSLNLPWNSSQPNFLRAGQSGPEPANACSSSDDFGGSDPLLTHRLTKFVEFCQLCL